MSSTILLSTLFVALGFNHVNAGLAGQYVPAYVGTECNPGLSYTYFPLGPGYPTCTVNNFGNTGYNRTGSMYSATFDIPDPGEGCQIFIRAPANVDDPQCGLVIHTFTQPACTTLSFPDPFDLNFCCGEDDCKAAVPVGSPTGKVKRNEILDVTQVKKTNPFRKIKARDTGNCAWAGNPTYTTIGQSQVVAANIICSGNETCSENFMGMVTTSSTNTFMISEAIEAGFFDIVSETTTFSYSYSYTKAQSVGMTYQYSVNAGTSGDLVWTPTLECTDGSFSGSDCQGDQIPTGTQGTACIPVHLGDLADGAPQGTFTFNAYN